jgi:protein tyrosine phosphatase (PTP) superfamily phosphohydrolase (DUF442 family)
MDVMNYQQVDQRIATSGQPKRTEFPQIAESGFGTVINLGLPSSEGAILDEGGLVTSAGMNYFHIPVEWQAPKLSQFLLFSSVMNAQLEEKVWVHCALNMRTSCFVYLYRVVHQGVSPEVAMEAVRKVWQPNEIWSGFISRAEAALG